MCEQHSECTDKIRLYGCVAYILFSVQRLMVLRERLKTLLVTWPKLRMMRTVVLCCCKIITKLV